MAEQDGPHLPSSGEMFVPPQRDVPAMSPPIEPAPPPVMPLVDLSQTDVLCRRCSFNLRGLTPDRNCPECGFPLWRSLQGDALIFSPTHYLKQLSNGLMWILIGYITQVVLSIVMLVVMFAMVFQSMSVPTATPLPTTTTQAALQLLNVPAAVILLIGWWMFSTPDPGIVSGNKGDGPRMVVRWSTVVLVVASFAASFIVIVPNTSLGIALFQGGVGLLSAAAGIAQFFGSLVYMRWIARRMQSASLVSQTQLYLWLLPLIYIVGSCLIVGPIVAFIMYVIMLYRVRTALQAIMYRQQTELPALDVPDQV